MKKIPLMTGDTRYAFASGRIRFLETKLITRAVAVKLLESQLDDFPRILAEYEYHLPSGLKTEDDIDRAFNFELEYLLKLVEFLSVDKKFPILIRKRYDFLNLAYLMKSKLSNVEFTPTIMGTINPSTIRRIFDNEEWDKLPPELHDGLVLAKKAYEETEFLSSIDSKLEWQYFAILKNSLPRLEFLKGYYELYFDMLNIMNIARCRAFGRTFKNFVQIYLDGGSFDLPFFRNIFELPQEQIISKLFETEFGRALGESFQSAIQHYNFTPLQNLIDKIILEYLEQTRYCPFGLELIFSYYKRKEREIGVIRTIAKAKLYNIPIETIRGSLPYGYS